MYNSDVNDGKTKEISTTEIEQKTVSRKCVVVGEEIELEYAKQEDAANEEVKVKKLINKKIIIGIICIIAVILCVVIYSVFNTGEKQVVNENELDDESHLLVTEKDTYEGLNYTVEKVFTQQIGFFYDYSRNLEGKKIDVSYLKVNGLKDESLQNKINDLLKEIVDNLYTKEYVQDNNILYDHIYNATNVYIFNNVLSTLYCKETCDIEGNVKYEYKGININLNNFEEIALKDVFLNNTNIENLMNEEMKSIYNIENFQFSISPKFVYIPLVNGEVETISLYKNKEQVAIYKRYADNKKMFSKTYNATPYVFTTKNFLETDVYGLIEDTLFVDTYNLLINSNYNDKVKEAADDLYKEAVNKARNLSYSNPSKRYLVQIIPYIENNEQNVYDIYVEYNVYELEKEFFNESIVEFAVASENKVDEETNKVKYFESPVMDAEQYLNKKESDVLTLQVDENGEEIEEVIDNNVIVVQPQVNEGVS